MARSSDFIDRPWCIYRMPSTRNATGWSYRVEMERTEPRKAQSLNEALKLVQTMTREGT